MDKKDLVQLGKYFIATALELKVVGGIDNHEDISFLRQRFISMAEFWGYDPFDEFPSTLEKLYKIGESLWE